MSLNAIYLVFAVPVLAIAVRGALIVAPENAASTIGGNVRFSCRTNWGGAVQWKFRDLDRNNTIWTVFDGTSITSRFQGRFTVAPSAGQYDLVISNVQNIDPGTYTCVELTSGGDTASALLSVITAAPVCSTTIRTAEVLEGTFERMQCNVSFNGTIWQRPQMTWYSYGEFVTNTSTVGRPNIAVWSVLEFYAEPPYVNFTCVTHFSTPYYSDDQPVNLSQTIPTYRYTYAPPRVRVVYLEEIEVLGLMDNNTVYINESIECFAEGHPPPVYRWYDVTANSVFNGPTIFFYDLGPRTLNCTATNVNNGITYSTSIVIDILVITMCTFDPCQNGATCDPLGNPLCTCPPGFSGFHCEIDVDECVSSPCQNGATCVDLVDGYSCSCASGFTGTFCLIDIDECASSPCQNWATCEDQENGFICSCRIGFTGTLCEKADITTPPWTSLIFYGVVIGTYDFTLSCVQQYGRQFISVFQEQVNYVQYLVNQRQLCQSMDLGTELLADKSFSSVVNGIVMEVAFSMDVKASSNNYIDQYVACSYQLGYYIADHAHWRQPILTQIAGCPSVSFDPAQFNITSLAWTCPLSN